MTRLCEYWRYQEVVVVLVLVSYSGVSGSLASR